MVAPRLKVTADRAGDGTLWVPAGRDSQFAVLLAAEFGDPTQLAAANPPATSRDSS